MLLPFVVYVGPCDGAVADGAVADGAVADAAAVRIGKGEGDRRKNALIRSRFFVGFRDKRISESTWIFPPCANCSGAFFFYGEVNESSWVEAVMITLLTSCATARRRRGAGKARSLDTSAATRDMQEGRIEACHASEAGPREDVGRLFSLIGSLRVRVR